MAKAGRIYLPLDVNYYEDARLVDVSPLAELLYIRCLCACKRLMTDGRLSSTQINRLGADLYNPTTDTGDPRDLTRELLAVSLLKGDSEAWMDITAWHQWNKSVEEIDEISARRAEAGRAGGLKSGRSRRGEDKKADARDNQIESNSKPAREPNPFLLTNTETETETYKDNARSRVTGFEAEFGECWAIYPRKLARKAALKAYIAQRRKGIAASTLIVAVRHFALAMRNEGRSEDKILYGATFFGPSDRWEDYVAPPKPTVSSAPVTRSRKESALGDVRAYRDIGQDDVADDLQKQIDAGEFD